MPATTIISSGTLDNVPGATGVSQTGGHLVYAVNSGRWWFFTWAGKLDSGTATSGSTTGHLDDTTKTWTTNQFLGRTCIITSGTGSGQSFIIGSNTAHSLPVIDDAGAATLATAPDTTSHYEIIESDKVHAYVSSGSDLSTATWSEATGSPTPTIQTASNNTGYGILVPGGSNNVGGAGQYPTDGRLLQVGYANVSGTDVFLLSVQMDSHYFQITLRGRLTATTTIAWDGVVNGSTTNNWNDTATGMDCVPEFPLGSTVGYSSTGRWWTMGDQNSRIACGYAANSADPGTANFDENWQSNQGASAPSSFDTGAGDTCQSALVPLASGFMLAVYCNGNTASPAGAGNATQTGLRYAESASATQWPTTSTGANVPNLSAATNDPNDWGIAARTNTDIHVVRRNGATALEHVRYSGHGGSWGSKVNLPTTGLTGQLAGSGVALVTDNVNVWCFVIDTDANHNIKYVKWTAGSWDASWSTLSTDTSVKNFITAYMGNGNGQIGVAWTVGSASPFSVEVGWLTLVVNNPFKNPAATMILTSPGGRAARRRVGFWHTIAHYNSVLIDYPQSRGYPFTRVLRNGKIGYRYILPTKSLILGLGTTVPVLNPAGNLYQSYYPRRTLRRRSRTWVLPTTTVGTIIFSGTQNPQTQIADVSVTSGARGRRPNNRGNIRLSGMPQSNTVYNDQVASHTSDRYWKNILRNSRAKEYPTSNFFAALSQYVYPPAKKLAEWWIQTVPGGGRLRRRASTMYGVVDYVNPLYNVTVGGTQPFLNVPDTSVTVSRGGRRPRRLGNWHLEPGTSNTTFQDVVISMTEDREIQRTVARFRNWDQAGARLGTWLNQPLKKLAEWWVQSSLSGRPARRRVGFWHTIADSNTPILQSERPALGTYDMWVQSGRVRGRSRNQGKLQIQTHSDTKTTYNDQVVSRTVDRIWRNIVRGSRPSDGQKGLLYTILSGFVPLKKIADWWVQSTKGGRPARRRVGYWHYVADQSNTSLGATGEIPTRMVADQYLMSGRVRSRRRSPGNWQGSNETKTIYQDIAIAISKGITWSRSSVGPAYIHNVSNKIAYSVKFFINMFTMQQTRTSIQTGLFRALGAFPDAIIVQFRTFTIKLLNKIDKS